MVICLGKSDDCPDECIHGKEHEDLGVSCRARCTRREIGVCVKEEEK